MSRRIVLLAAGCCLAVVLPAAAQTRPAPATGPKHEISVGGVFSLPSSMGSADAELLGSNGEPSLTLFSTKNSMSFGVGPELILGFRAKPGMWFEVAGNLTWPSLSSTIEDDLEGAETQTLSARVTRWTVEGALVWWIKDKGRTTWFIRAGGGIVGEVSGDLSSSATGAMGSGGFGVRHWFRESKGGRKKMGWRAEFRGVVQGGGLSLDDRTVRFTPTGTFHLVFGY
jgi:hypothetical protein